MADNILNITILADNKKATTGFKDTDTAFSKLCKSVTDQINSTLTRMEAFNDFSFRDLIESAGMAESAIAKLSTTTIAATADFKAFIDVVKPIPNILKSIATQGNNAADGLANLGARSRFALTAVRDMAPAADAAAVSLDATAVSAKTASTAISGLGRSATNTDAKLDLLSATPFDSTGIIAGADAATVALDATLASALGVRAAVAGAARGRVGAVSWSAAGGVAGAHGGSGLMPMMVGAALLAPVVLSIKQGAEFEAALHKLQATAGDTADFETLREELLKVANQFDQMPTGVANAFYPIESAGFRGADGLKVLSAAAAFARGSQADLTLSTQLISKTLVAYGLTADNAARVSDVLTKAVKNSLVPAKDFVPALANIKATGNAVGLTLEELSTGLDLMTQQTKSAATGSTYLKNFLMGIVNPAQATRKEAKQLGLEWLATGRGMEEIHKVGLAGVLHEIEVATHGSREAQIQLYPDMRKNQALLILLADGGAKFNRTLKDNINSMGATHDANLVMDNDLLQSGKDIASLNATAQSSITHGVEPALLGLADVVKDILTWFNKLPTSVQAVGAEFLAFSGTTLILSGAIQALSRSLAGLGINFGVASTAGGGFMASLAPMAARGGLIGLVAAAIVGLGIELNTLADDWHDTSGDINKANSDKQAVIDQRTTLSQTGEMGALIAEHAKIVEQISKTQDTIDTLKANRKNVGVAGNTVSDKEFYTLIVKAVRAKNALEAAADLETARMHVLSAPRSEARTAGAGPIGIDMAQAADSVVKGTNGFCERTAGNLRSQVTKVFEPFSNTGSAMGTITKMLKAGVLQPYKPGDKLRPGDQIYSSTLGYERGKDGKMHHFGHVETVNSAGDRIDESGEKNRFALSNFQYKFNPDYAASVMGVTGSGRGTLGGKETNFWQRPVIAKKTHGLMPSIPDTAVLSQYPPLTEKIDTINNFLKGHGNHKSTMSAQDVALADAQAKIVASYTKDGEITDERGLKIALGNAKLDTLHKQAAILALAMADATKEVQAHGGEAVKLRQSYISALNTQSNFLKSKGGKLTTDADKEEYKKLGQITRTDDQTMTPVVNHFSKLISTIAQLQKQQESLQASIDSTTESISSETSAQTAATVATNERNDKHMDQFAQGDVPVPGPMFGSGPLGGMLQAGILASSGSPSELAEAYYKKRLDGVQAYSDEWYEIQGKIAELDKQVSEEHKQNSETQERTDRNSFESMEDDFSKRKYLLANGAFNYAKYVSDLKTLRASLSPGEIDLGKDIDKVVNNYDASGVLNQINDINAALKITGPGSMTPEEAIDALKLLVAPNDSIRRKVTLEIATLTKKVDGDQTNRFLSGITSDAKGDTTNFVDALLNGEKSKTALKKFGDSLEKQVKASMAKLITDKLFQGLNDMMFGGTGKGDPIAAILGHKTNPNAAKPGIKPTGTKADALYTRSADIKTGGVTGAGAASDASGGNATGTDAGAGPSGALNQAAHKQGSAAGGQMQAAMALMTAASDITQASGAGGQKKRYGGLLGGILGGIAGAFTGDPVGGFEMGSMAGSMLGFAEGGYPPMGRISMVGERGPEPFIPATHGRIVSNEEARAAMGVGGNGGGSGGHHFDMHHTTQIFGNVSYGQGEQQSQDVKTWEEALRSAVPVV